ncbi:MAG: DUF1294 domain-containing protein [Clostridia bacterium]|nr:DUF1294 domain-containing protein [Clostridia bacterium]
MPILSTALLVLRTLSPRSNIEFLLENKILLIFALAYLLVISIISISVTGYDKWAAKKRPKERTRESTLLLLSALGGSVAMLLTMYGIRHKTKHIKFMLGIPLIILLQLAVVLALLFLI